MGFIKNKPPAGEPEAKPVQARGPDEGAMTLVGMKCAQVGSRQWLRRLYPPERLGVALNRRLLFVAGQR